MAEEFLLPSSPIFPISGDLIISTGRSVAPFTESINIATSGGYDRRGNLGGLLHKLAGGKGNLLAQSSLWVEVKGGSLHLPASPYHPHAKLRMAVISLS